MDSYPSPRSVEEIDGRSDDNGIDVPAAQYTGQQATANLEEPENGLPWQRHMDSNGFLDCDHSLYVLLVIIRRFLPSLCVESTKYQVAKREPLLMYFRPFGVQPRRVTSLKPYQ